MYFDFAGRYSTAFGFTPGHISNALIEAGFNRAIKQHHDTNFKASVYVFDNNTHFDEVMLYNDSEEYLFAYRELAEEYSQVFATPPILSLRRAKNLIITPLDNSDIEVIERYSTEPYQITFKGLLIDMEDHNFPLDKLETLNKIFEVNSIWKVSSEILAAVGVDSIIIQDINIEFVEGYEDTIAYTFVARATKSIEYQLINE
ncbi:DUF6046 domain-containing protein [Dysgonomonas sp. ZJ279]|uniref:DUF6046 domain-containing protein n=1 Tax=Dysgonomonas sp. ZJ279 TaxID=2709796 RepID=UPI0013EA83B5|nr:DUF6046 domain-containing protein [Dysgonomonas sp. ZJ279]